MLNINLKNLFFALFIVLGVSSSSQAQNIENHQELQFSCSFPKPSPCLSDFNVSNQQLDNDSLITQRIRRKIRKPNKDVYGGFSFGLFLPNSKLRVSDADVSLNTGFGGSILAGVKFNKNLGADLEFLLGFGSLDTDELQKKLNRERPSDRTELDGNYTLWGLYFNPRYEIFLSETKDFKAYLSPGIGVSRSSSTIEFDSQSTVVNSSRDFEKTGFSFQFKGGVAYPINKNANVFGQVRYANLPAEGDNINLINTEIGIGFEF
ncbi:MAG: hypothetical protein Tsb0014_01420 [Pleurocapsa sp.]